MYQETMCEEETVTKWEETWNVSIWLKAWSRAFIRVKRLSMCEKVRWSIIYDERNVPIKKCMLN